MIPAREKEQSGESFFTEGPICSLGLSLGDQIAFPVAAMPGQGRFQGLFGRLDFGIDPQEVRFLRGRADDFDKRQLQRRIHPIAVSPESLVLGGIHLE